MVKKFDLPINILTMCFLEKKTIIQNKSEMRYLFSFNGTPDIFYIFRFYNKFKSIEISIDIERQKIVTE